MSAGQLRLSPSAAGGLAGQGRSEAAGRKGGRKEGLAELHGCGLRRCGRVSWPAPPGEEPREASSSPSALASPSPPHLATHLVQVRRGRRCERRGVSPAPNREGAGEGEGAWLGVAPPAQLGGPPRTPRIGWSKQWGGSSLLWIPALEELRGPFKSWGGGLERSLRESPLECCNFATRPLPPPNSHPGPAGFLSVGFVPGSRCALTRGGGRWGSGPAKATCNGSLLQPGARGLLVAGEATHRLICRRRSWEGVTSSGLEEKLLDSRKKRLH